LSSYLLGAAVAVVVSLAAPGGTGVARGQVQGPSETLAITAARAATWGAEGVEVVQVEGPVRIETQRATMSARRAVVWLTRAKDRAADERHAEIALIGEASIAQANNVAQAGERLYVDLFVRGAIAVTAEQRSGEDLSSSDLYREASAIRPIDPQSARDRQQATRWLLQQPSVAFPGPPTTLPSTRPYVPRAPVAFSAAGIHTRPGRDGTVCLVLQGSVLLTQDRGENGLLELKAERAVVFTLFKAMRELEGTKQRMEEAIVGAYLEGDVQVIKSPGGGRKAKPEQRLTANRVYYDFAQQRAVLTDVVLHTYDYRKQMPVVLRAEMARQLSDGEFTATNARITSSLFHTPTYSIGATSAYVRQEALEGDVATSQTAFSAKDATLRLGPVPVFYLPYVAGVVNDRGPLQNVQVNQSNRMGFGAVATWGVFETLGRLPPADVDLTYNVGYFAKRGPAVGVDGRYAGDITPYVGPDPWTFTGELTGTLVYDEGTDILGSKRAEVEPPTPWRGRLDWRHQLFIPNDWQIQLSASYTSDATFLEEWFQDEYNRQYPRTSSVYVKRQRETEAVTLAYSVALNNFPSGAETVHEQVEVERVPEVGYHRIGDSLLDDTVTFISNNSVAGLRFQLSHSSLAEQGYGLVEGDRRSPGLPSYGYTGTQTDVTYRGDFRQEVDFPFAAGEYKVVPYLVGRYTAYSAAPDTDAMRDRLFGGLGVRIATHFWKVDDTVSSGLLDLHRLRHVVEPEVNVFYGATSADRNGLYVYDEEIDGIHDLGAVQFALRQRWQTKRGGPGRWRNVDVLTLNVEANWFFRAPADEELTPRNFRGQFYPSLPEASIPRSGVNADLALLVSDATSLLADAQYNWNENKLATASVGLQVRHDPRLTYYIGLRYLGVRLDEFVPGAGRGDRFQFKDQQLIIFTANYELTRKYTVTLSERYDFAQPDNARHAVTLIRKFDRFAIGLTARVDKVGQENFIGITLIPEGVGRGGAAGGTGQLQSVLGR